MNKFLIRALAVGAFGVGAAHAGQISFLPDGYYPGLIGRIDTPMIPVSATITGDLATGTASYAKLIGSYIFSPPSGGPQSLEIVFDKWGDMLTGTVTWPNLGDDLFVPQLVGSYAITTSVGDVGFTTSFSVGSVATIDLTAGPISFYPNPVPEPNVSYVFLLAAIGVAVWSRVRKEMPDADNLLK